MNNQGKKKNYTLGILAYGSLIDDPGFELEPLIIDRIQCKTPFNIEYARSSSGRNNAPTLIPVEKDGGSVNAVILVLNDAVSLEEAEDMLWRRETGIVGESKKYPRRKTYGVNAVQVKTLNNFNEVKTVLYTSIGSNLPIHPPPVLAKLAVESILDQSGEDHRDGVRYLNSAVKNGIITPLTNLYIQLILEMAGTDDLDSAIEHFDNLRPEALKKKNKQRDFEEKVKLIFEFITEYGLRQMPEAQNIEAEQFLKFFQDNKQAFLKNCHTGFKKAQAEILQLMLQLEEENELLERERKKIAKKIEPARFEEVEDDIFDNGNRQAILRHLIDSIAWQMLNGQLYMSRRLYAGVKGKKKLTHSNIASVVEAARIYNEVELDFALITDLSAYIQIGDLLVFKNGSGLEIVEVKQGAKNREVLEIVHKVTETDEPLEKIFKNVKLDSHMIKQIDRNLTQYVESLKIIQILNTDKGEDRKGRKVSIATPKEKVTPRFDETLMDLEQYLVKRPLWAYNVVDDCLHIGLSKGEFRHMGKDMLKKIAEEEKFEYVIIDYRRVINSLFRPVFTLSVSKQLRLDLVFGKVHLYFMINIDAFLSLFPKYGITAAWISAKETMKVIGSNKEHQLFLVNNRAIRITDNDTKRLAHLTHGFFGKMYYEHITPDYLAYSCRYLLGIEDEDQSEGES